MEHSSEHQRSRGDELHFIKPVILGGDPEDKNNVTFLNRSQHIQAVRYWNKIVRDLKTRRTEEDGKV